MERWSLYLHESYTWPMVTELLTGFHDVNKTFIPPLRGAFFLEQQTIGAQDVSSIAEEFELVKI